MPLWLRISHAAAVLLVGSISACSSGLGSNSAPPPVGPVPVIQDPGQISLPLDGYEPTADQAATISRASHLVADRCMREFGLNAPEETYDAFTQEVQEVKKRNQLYGYFVAVGATGDGYDRNQAIPPSTLSPDVNSVLYGTDASGQAVADYHGRPVPKGGCWQVGADALGGPPPLPGTPQALPAEGPRIPLTDPRLRTAYAAWSDCMRQKGYRYTNPADAYSDRKWGGAAAPATQGHDPLEVSTAEADVACKISLNTVGQVVAVEIAYDRQYIAANTRALQTFTQQLAARTRRAETVIANGGAV
ncbi:hypothetical protein ACFYNO_23700 [Kitasatospora sp. NPDC006697]|uniref:hypothetical protein n=1 Tax=Kitasatospora sp. NPDC006697 TaxID=3364020 RepID=UPI0036D1CB52